MIVGIKIEEIKSTSEVNLPLKWFNELYGAGSKSFMTEVKVPKSNRYPIRGALSQVPGTYTASLMQHLDPNWGWDSQGAAQVNNSYDAIVQHHFQYTFLFEHTKMDLQNDHHMKFWKVVMKALAKLDKTIDHNFTNTELDRVSALFVKEGEPQRLVTCVNKVTNARDEWEWDNNKTYAANTLNKAMYGGQQVGKTDVMDFALGKSDLDRIMRSLGAFGQISAGTMTTLSGS